MKATGLALAIAKPGPSGTCPAGGAITSSVLDSGTLGGIEELVEVDGDPADSNGEEPSAIPKPGPSGTWPIGSTGPALLLGNSN